MNAKLAETTHVVVLQMVIHSRRCLSLTSHGLSAFSRCCALLWPCDLQPRPGGAAPRGGAVRPPAFNLPPNHDPTRGLPLWVVFPCSNGRSAEGAAAAMVGSGGWLWGAATGPAALTTGADPGAQSWLYNWRVRIHPWSFPGTDTQGVMDTASTTAAAAVSASLLLSVTTLFCRVAFFGPARGAPTRWRRPSSLVALV